MLKFIQMILEKSKQTLQKQKIQSISYRKCLMRVNEIVFSSSLIAAAIVQIPPLIFWKSFFDRVLFSVVAIASAFPYIDFMKLNLYLFLRFSFKTKH